jgi:hypothetical protein
LSPWITPDRSITVNLKLRIAHSRLKLKPRLRPNFATRLLYVLGERYDGQHDTEPEDP